MKITERQVPKLRFKENIYSPVWDKVKLGEYASYRRGSFPQPYGNKDWYNGPSSMPFVQVVDVSTNLQLKESTQQRISLKAQPMSVFVEKGSIVVTLQGSIGRVAITQFDSYVDRTLLIFEHYTRKTDLHFWAYTIQKKFADEKKKAPGGTIKTITKEALSSFEVEVPEYNEQKNIGRFFKTIDQMIQLQQSKANKVKDIKSAYLSEMFPKEGEKYPKKRFEGFTEPWQKRKLDTIANNFDTLRVPVTAADRIPGDTPYYGANGIQDYVEGYTHDGEYILLAEDGANDLNNYPVHYVNGKVWVNNHAHVLQGNHEVLDNRFLMYKLKTIDMQPYLVGGGRAKLNANVMMSIEIALPEIEEQRKIGRFFKNLDNQISVEEEKIDKLEKLKQAYLNDMFV